MNIAVAALHNDNPSIVEMAEETIYKNKKAYCEKHGYDLVVNTEDFGSFGSKGIEHFGFAKLPMILNLFEQGYDWVYWTGTDTLVTNFDIKLESLIDENYHLIVACDIWDWNIDCFLAKNSERTKEFLRKIISQFDDYVDEEGRNKSFGYVLKDGGAAAWAEQGAFIIECKGTMFEAEIKPEYRDFVKELPQKAMNSYIYNIYPSKFHQQGLDYRGRDGRWTEGDFMLHIPGLPNNIRMDIIRQIKAGLKLDRAEGTRKVWYAPNKFESYGEEEIKAVNECLRDGWLAGFGPRSKKFEEEIAKEFGKKYGVFVNSGSSACLLAIASLDLPKGSKVITPALTFSTTLAPIVQLGLEPIFVDSNPTSYVPEVSDIINVVTEDTKAVMIPNLIGNKPDWKLLKSELARIGREDIVIIEDSADTVTTTEDSDISTTSFYASHVITAGGTGGMVMFNDEKYLKKCLMYRDWGRIGDNSEIMSERFSRDIDGIPYDYKFLYGVLGYNMKCSEMNAAFGLVQLQRFQAFKDKRRKNVERYLENLKDVEQIVLPDDSIKPNWLAIPLQCENRLDLLNYLEDNRVQTRVTFAGNVTRHPIYREYLQEFKNADLVMKNGFLLGAHHGMDLNDVDYVCDKIKEYFA